MIRFFVIIFLIETVYSAEAQNSSTTEKVPRSDVPKKVRTVEELNKRKNESVLDFIGLVERHKGYTAEEYKVTTEDKYILGLHRITGSPSKPKAAGKKVVYLQHGLFGSSDLMVLFGPENCLAFQLVDAGYDVWLGNVRGNIYSRAHVDYSPDMNISLFWDFSLDHIALLDLPAMIDFVLKETKQEKLTYIGYSMGTIVGHMLLSDKPEYNDKFNLVVHLAPAIYFLKPISMAMKFAAWTLLTNAKLFLKYELMTNSIQLLKLGLICGDSASSICITAFAKFTSVDKMNLTAVPEILAYSPAGTSYYVVEHYEQIFNSNGHLAKYDFCYSYSFLCIRNNNKYGQSTPPEYNSNQITVPVAIYYGENDNFAGTKDVQYLKSKLSNVVTFERVADPKFNHMDFIWHSEAKRLVYDRVLETVNKY